MNRSRLVVPIAILHLTVVATFLWDGAASDSDPARTSPVMESYRVISGLFRDYKFFAPSVANDVRAGVLIEDGEGRTSFQTFAADSHEADLRVNCIISAAMKHKGGKDMLVRSLATAALATDPSGIRATVVTEAYDVPTMADFARGVDPKWKLIYTGKFERKQP